MRLKNTLNNVVWNLFSQFLLVITGLIVKKVLLDTIGTEKIGLNYLFNDMIKFISIAELGLTGIIAYHLYEPLATKNHNQVIKLIEFFRKAYLLIGLVVIAIGLGIIPFLHFFIGKTALDVRYISVIFILFLLRNTESYFFSYKAILPYADQKEYIVTVVNTIMTAFYSLVSIFVILYTKNYIYVLLLEVITMVISDLIIIRIVNKKYPYIRHYPRIRLEKSDIAFITKDMKNAFLAKASKAVILTSDNIIMTMYIGLHTTGLFSNYTLVLYTVQTFLQQLIVSAQASIGNLLVTAKKETIHTVVNRLTFIAFLLVSVCGCCLYQLTSPFIAIIFDRKYVMAQSVVTICVFNIYLDIMQRPMAQLADGGGLFQHTKRINILSCALNLILSLLGVNLFGIIGVLLGTLISRIVEFLLRIEANFKEILNKSSLRYYLWIILYTSIFSMEVFAVKSVCHHVQIKQPYLKFILQAILSGMIPVIINIILFYRTDNFQYVVRLIHILMKTKECKE